MCAQIFLPSPSATSLCLPKRIVVHFYKIKTPFVYTTSVRTWPSIKTKSCGTLMKFSVQILHTKSSSNGFTKIDQWHWHLTKWCTRIATRSVRTSLPIWVELSTDDLSLNDWTVGGSFVKTGAVKAAFFLTESTKFCLSSLHSVGFG
jgi:hypothetical protein